MPTLSTFEVESGNIWGYYSGGIRYIYDVFERVTPTGTLGISTNGQPWSTLAGSWNVPSSGYAQAVGTAISGVGPYPLVAFDLVNINQLAYCNNYDGVGLAFSIIDANNWYAIAPYVTITYYNCNCLTCVECNTCTYGCTTGPSCAYCGVDPYGGCFSCTYGCVTNGLSCQSCGQTQYTCDCQQCPIYRYYVTTLQSINGIVYTISTTQLSSPSDSISVELNNGIVNYYVYSTTISGIITQPYGLGTVVVSGTFTISGTLGTQIGAVQTPNGNYNMEGFFGIGLYGV